VSQGLRTAYTPLARGYVTYPIRRTRRLCVTLLAMPETKTCAHCGDALTDAKVKQREYQRNGAMLNFQHASLRRTRFCSTRCRVAAHRAKHRTR
jgi:hypothetical protein